MAFARRLSAQLNVKRAINQRQWLANLQKRKKIYNLSQHGFDNDRHASFSLNFSHVQTMCNIVIF